MMEEKRYDGYPKKIFLPFAAYCNKRMMLTKAAAISSRVFSLTSQTHLMSSSLSSSVGGDRRVVIDVVSDT